jgi:hypothetical protein
VGNCAGEGDGVTVGMDIDKPSLKIILLRKNKQEDELKNPQDSILESAQLETYDLPKILLPASVSLSESALP